MGQKPPVQASQPDPTAYIKVEDQSLATNKAAVAIPLGFGEHKFVGNPITPIYGWSGQRVTSGAGGKGGKGGGGTSTTIYRGTIGYSFCIGPIFSESWILVNGIRALETSIAKVDGEDYVDLTLPGFMSAAIRLYWGTETQTADPFLSAFEVQPGRRGKVYIVWKNAPFGSNGETQAPTIELCTRRIPQQSVIDNSGGAASNDGGFTANGLVAAAEVFTSWDFMEKSDALLDIESWQDTADAIEALRADGQDAETDSDRSAVATSPMFTERVTARSFFVDIARATNAWFREGSDGKIEAGYWKRSVDLSGVTDLAPDDVTEIPEPKRGDAQELRNSFIIEFTDSNRHHKSNCITVNNTADIRNRGVRRQTLKREDLLREYQARIAGNEARRAAEIPDLSITVKVKRRKARNPDGSRIRPGDYFRYPLQLIPSEPSSLTLFRCVRVDFEPTGEITIDGELEKLGALSSVVPDVPEVSRTDVMPPAYFRRLISFRHQDYLAINSPLFALVARPDSLAINCQILYGETADGDFQSVGNQPSYALPVSLEQSLSAAATTVRVKLLPVTASGANPRRDSSLLTDWQGGSTEARDDTLLLILIAKSGGAITAQEVCSISGPATVVATDTYDVPVLRGRRWSTAQAFSAGSFPDAFANYEGWIIRRDQLADIWHNDWLPNPLTGARPTIYIRYTPIGLGKIYDGETAFAEYERRTDSSEDLAEFEFQTDETHQPTDLFGWPFIRGGNYVDLFPPYFGPGSLLAYHRERGGDYALCGHSTFDGTLPGRRWKLKRITGTMKAEWYSAPACPVPGTLIMSGSGSYAGKAYSPYYYIPPMGVDVEMTFSYSAVLISETEVQVSFSASGTVVAQDTPGWGPPLGPFTPYLVIGAVPHAPGSTIIVPWNTYFSSGDWEVLAWDGTPIPHPSMPWAFGGPIKVYTIDIWDRTEDFGAHLPGACENTVTDNSVRTVNGEEITPFPAAYPANDIYPHRVVTTEALVRETTGDNVCYDLSSGYIYALASMSERQLSGFVAREELSEEDTQEDAIARLEATLADWDAIGDSPCTSFPCGYSKWEARTGDGIVAEKTQGKMHFIGGDYTPNITLFAEIQLMRTHLESSTVEYILDYSETEIDEDGNLDFFYDMPHEEGYLYQMRIPPTFRVVEESDTPIPEDE